MDKKDFKIITAKDNPLIKLVSRLQGSSKTRAENGLFVLEGLRLLQDAYENGIYFEKLIASATVLEKHGEELSQFLQNAEEKVKIPDSLFLKISDTKNPQGVCAVCRMTPRSANAINRNGRYIVLENLSDPANLGAIARTGEALGVSGLIVVGGCDPYSPKVLRASMGTVLRLPIFLLDDPTQCGLRLYACVVDSTAVPIGDISFGNGCAVVIGNEANGISESVQKAVDHRVTIPMNGRAESLNAAAAAAIAVWEMMK